MIDNNFRGDIRIHVGKGPDNLHIEVTDAGSGIRVLEFDVPMVKVGEMLFGTGITVKANISTSNKLGLQHEVKNEVIWFPKRPLGLDDKTAAQAKEVNGKVLQPFLIDGWEPDIACTYNPHRRVKKAPPEGSKAEDGDWFDVPFHRWIKPRRVKKWPVKRRG